MRNFLGTLTICALLASSSFFLTSCGGWNPAPSREIPTGGIERAKKNVKEGKGISLGALGRGETNTNYQFSTSNPMWRAAFDVIDFMPLVTVDYSGGTIITDWYTDQNNIKQRCKLNIFIRGVELKTDNLKVNSFCQTLSDKNNWIDEKVSSENNIKIENAILNKAKKIRLSQS